MNHANDNAIAARPRLVAIVTVMALLLCATSSTALAEQSETSESANIPTACDLLAGHPSDPDKITDGVKTEQVMTYLPLAIEACRRDAALFPDQPRLTYYLGRSLFYSGEAKEGFAMVDAAANAGHEQAQFVGGLLAMAGAATGTADPCLARDYWERGRAQGHFAATVSVATHQKLDTFA
ncbi:MAG: hypothetical protein AB8B96_21600, partial [Lysobacterales bacterium]